MDPDDQAWMEDPGYPGARAALALAGAAVVNIPVDREGMQVAAGLRRAPNARLAYVTPPHQFPMGVAMSAERRFALLDWAEKHDAWILEDDYDGEFRYVGQPLTPLYSLDQHARVLYLGTLSKSMFVSLRLAFAVVPEAMVEQTVNIRTQFDAFSAPLSQLAMSRFMDEGHFSTHVRQCAACTPTSAPFLRMRCGHSPITAGPGKIIRSACNSCCVMRTPRKCNAPRSRVAWRFTCSIPIGISPPMTMGCCCDLAD
jgi:GntR family transcriptional regulator / MocR family aminotransferase